MPLYFKGFPFELAANVLAATWRRLNAKPPHLYKVAATGVQLSKCELTGGFNGEGIGCGHPDGHRNYLYESIAMQDSRARTS